MSDNNNEKKLGLMALLAMVVGSMTGAGIFMLPAKFAGATGVYGSLISWLIAGSGMLMLAFVFQSLAVRKPDINAGIFAYAQEGFGDYIGFIMGIGYWACACAGNVTYLVLVQSTLGEVIPALGDGDTIIALLVSSVLLWAYFLLISKGVQQAAVINTIVTIAKVIPILVFIIVTIVYFDFHTFKENLSGNYPGYSLSLFEQIKKTMLITVFVFIGIEGASIYSRYAKTRKIVGTATILGFISVLCLLMMVSVLPFGVLSQEKIAGMREPSMAGIMEGMMGVPGGVFISVGLLVSILGAYLAWSLMAAEVLFTVAEKGLAPAFIKKENKVKAPRNALLLSGIMVQVILIASHFVKDALDFVLDLTAALALLPYFFTALYAFKITKNKDGFDGVKESTCKRELILASIACIYTVFLICVAGLQYLLLSCLILAPSTVLYVIAKKAQKISIFSKIEIIIFAILCIGFVIAVVGIATGKIIV